MFYLFLLKGDLDHAGGMTGREMVSLKSTIEKYLTVNRLTNNVFCVLP